jgi:hypothetical protein
MHRLAGRESEGRKRLYTGAAKPNRRGDFLGARADRDRPIPERTYAKLVITTRAYSSTGRFWYVFND